MFTQGEKIWLYQKNNIEELLNFGKKEIVNSVELSEILNGKLISVAYHSGKIENEKITHNDTREIFEHDGVVKYTRDYYLGNSIKLVIPVCLVQASSNIRTRFLYYPASDSCNIWTIKQHKSVYKH